MQSIEFLSCLISSLCHDVGHLGFNNRFLMQTKHSMAITYNDISVLEQMHASLTFQELQVEDQNILEKLTL